MKPDSPGTWTTVQGPPAAGFCWEGMLPELSLLTHSNAVGQLSPRSPKVLSALECDQLGVVAHGLDDVSTSPFWPTATHRLVEGQLTPERKLGPSMLVGRDQAAAPPVGSVVVTTLPALSTATHRVDEGAHATSAIWAASMVTGALHPPEAGLAVVTI